MFQRDTSHLSLTLESSSTYYCIEKSFWYHKNKP
ncbi:hypothetical protein AZ010_001462, partial [Klebsiella pneumoniae]